MECAVYDREIDEHLTPTEPELVQEHDVRFIVVAALKPGQQRSSYFWIPGDIPAGHASPTVSMRVVIVTNRRGTVRQVK